MCGGRNPLQAASLEPAGEQRCAGDHVDLCLLGLLTDLGALPPETN
jgi:hypothetical protein